MPTIHFSGLQYTYCYYIMSHAYDSLQRITNYNLVGNESFTRTAQRQRYEHYYDLLAQLYGMILIIHSLRYGSYIILRMAASVTLLTFLSTITYFLKKSTQHRHTIYSGLRHRHTIDTYNGHTVDVSVSHVTQAHYRHMLMLTIDISLSHVTQAHQSIVRYRSYYDHVCPQINMQQP
jgi:hypothetical protein